MALHNATTGQPITYCTSGNVAIGATLSTGTHYFVSSNTSKICPFADLNTGDWASMVGFALNTTVMTVEVRNRNVQVP